MSKPIAFAAIVAVFLGAGIANAQQAQRVAATPPSTAAQQPSKCYMRIGNGSTPGAALIKFEGPTVQLFFDRNGKQHYDAVAAGQDFTATAMKMYHQGHRPVSSDSSGRYVFDNGEGMFYKIAVSGSVLSGEVATPNKGTLPLAGACS